MTPLVQGYAELLESITLATGSHPERSNGLCAMEAAAYLAGEPHSDHPQCASPMITSLMIGWNDSLPTDAERDRLLKPLLPLVIDTRGTDEDEWRRVWMVVDWSLRDALPRALDLFPETTDGANQLRGLPDITSKNQVSAAIPILDSLRARARDLARDLARADVDGVAEGIQQSRQDLVRRMCAVGK